MTSVSCPHCETAIELPPELAAEPLRCTACKKSFILSAAESVTPADLGILLVHGIGQPSRGDTLVRFGDPICQWIRRWAEGAIARDHHEQEPEPPNYQALSLTVREGWIRQRQSDPEAPPHSKVVLEARDQAGKTETRTWLLAESRWANSFLTPRFSDLAWWGLNVAPWVNASHVGLRIRRLVHRARHLRAPVRWVALAACVPVAIGFSLSALVVSCVLLLLVPLILILAIPPIPRFRTFLLRVQGGLASTVGDSYVLLASPIQGAAITSQVATDLRWIKARCRRLAIVAHSQGAAITYEALRTRVLADLPKDQAILITFGSGLSKLEEIRRQQASTRWEGWGWGPIFGLLAILTALHQLELIELRALPRVLSTAWSVVLLMWGALIWSVSAIESIRTQRFTSEEFDPHVQFGIGLEWLDIYTNADPVPNGPLFDEHRRPSYLQSQEIHNYGSRLSDHTAYWKNEDGFVNLVVTRLAKFAALPFYWLRPFDRHRLLLAPRRRRCRVDCLGVGVSWLLAVAAVLLIGRAAELEQYGSNVVTAFGMLPKWQVVEWIETWAAAPQSPLLWWLGAAYLLVPVVVAYGLLYGIWRLWEKHDIDCLLERSEYGQGHLILLTSLSLSLLIFASCWSLGWVPDFSEEHTKLHVLPLLLGPSLDLLRFWASTKQFDSALKRGWAILWALGIPATVFVACTRPYLTDDAMVLVVAVLTVGIFAFGWLYDSKIRLAVHTWACVGNPKQALQRSGDAGLTTL